MLCVYIAVGLTLVYSERIQDDALGYRCINTTLLKDKNAGKWQHNLKVSAMKKPIVGGKYVMNIEEYPFMAFLFKKHYIQKRHKRYNSTGICGATVLNEKYLLTAAHCVMGCEPNYERYPEEWYTIYAGGLSINRASAKAKVKRFIVHNEYYCNKKHVSRNRNDIAVVELKEELPFSSKISKVNLPPSPPTNTCVVLGIGKNSLHIKVPHKQRLLKEAEVQIMSGGCPKSPDISKICTLGNDKNKINNFCGGDSGGPLLCNGVQVGIVTYGSKLCSPNTAGGYTRVEYFLDWINANIEGNNNRG